MTDDAWQPQGEKCKKLVRDYNLSGGSGSKNDNLNLIMQYCGVVYRMVGSRVSASSGAMMNRV